MIYDFFYKNYQMIYFIYGLFFFLMGFAIALQLRAYRQISSLQLSKSLWLLAVFGITHGLSEWSVVFVPLQRQYSSINYETIRIIQDLFRTISFLFLFYFGVHSITDTIGRKKWLRIIPMVVFVFWLIYFIAFPIFVSSNFKWWMKATETWTRYLLALPGAGLSSFAFFLQYKHLKPFTQKSVASNIKYTALVLAIYALVAGVVVPKAHFFPASYLNVDNFFRTLHIPVQIFRALCGLALAYFVIRVLELFELENKKLLEDAHRINILCQERNRFSRDMHDGIIQKLYTVGLQLENASYLVQEDSNQARDQINNTMNELNSVVKDIRNYILALQPINFQEPDLEKGIKGIIENVRANSLIHMDFHVHGEKRLLSADANKHIYHIVQEALNNTVKHARATMVQVELFFGPDSTEIIIRDNGQGFKFIALNEENLSGHQRGLKNMYDRCQLMGAVLGIDSDNHGTSVKITI